ncbi:hypothetical protein ACM25P_20280 [Vreelandella alkaliphila]|uniref:hypothetical protein n=1 Tax=Halomonadaceae TaxID=28256 RepID=UPI0013D66D78|nr:hypothetical protein [Modicisalibacter sp. 'Wilcox']
MSFKIIAAILAAIGITAAVSVTVYIEQKPDDSGKRLEVNEKQETIVGDEEPAGLPER